LEGKNKKRNGNIKYKNERNTIVGIIMVENLDNEQRINKRKKRGTKAVRGRWV